MHPDNERFAQELIDAGRYATQEAVIDAALRRWRVEYEEGLAELRAKIQVGLDDVAAGRVAPLDMEEIKREAREGLGVRSGAN